MRTIFILLFTISLSAGFLFAQNETDRITIEVKAQHENWVHKVGEEAEFVVEIKKNDQIIEDVDIVVQVGLERMPPTMDKTLKLKNGKTVIKGGTLEQPGFLRCIVTAEVEGEKYRGLATAAFDPEKITPTTYTPSDFMHFWDSLKTEASVIPLNEEMRWIPEKSTPTVNVYEVRLQNIDNTQVYGMLAVPKKKGKYPAILKVPGAGVRSYSADVSTAKKGFIVFSIGVHGIPVSMGKEEYTKLANNKLKGYPLFNANDRNKYYFKRVYIGCIRAIDYLTALTEYDGTNLGVSGGSQGGALTIVTAALDSRVKAIVAYFPGLSDLTGYTKGRAGGWPHTLNKQEVSEDEIETSRYYDVVNFAKMITVPGLYSWGFNDETCPPTSIYSAYNLINAPKELVLIKEAGHQYFPLQRKRMGTWMEAKLRGEKEEL